MICCGEEPETIIGNYWGFRMIECKRCGKAYLVGRVDNNGRRIVAKRGIDGKET